MDDNMRALFGQGGPPRAAKLGAFVHWTEDDDSVEIRLPLPEGTTKHEIKAVFSPTSLAVSVRADGTRLLVVSHLHARIVSDETTWYLENDVMTLTLAKMPAGGSAWGASLSSDAEGCTFSCWLTPTEVAKRLGEPDPSTLARAAGGASDVGTDWTMVAAASAVAVLVVAMAVLYFSDS